MDKTLWFIGVNKDSLTAGPGERLELFTKGCIRGVVNPCKGCFNEATWTFKGLYREMSVQETADMIDRDAWNQQVTFCGGEPMLQTVALLQLAKELKERDCHFHIVMYTAYNFNKLLKHGLYFHWREKHGEAMKIALRHYSQEYDGDLHLIASSSVFKELIHYIDLIVDGDYQQDKRMTIAPTMHKGGFIGSSNQRVIDCPQSVQTGNFTYSYADKYMDWYSHQNHCKACGHVIPNNQRFCDSRCDDNYQHRLIFLSKHGLQKRFKSFLK